MSQPDGRNILIVEDEPKYRKLIGTNLRLAGYRVSETGHAHEALQDFYRSEPDLVILDLRLPDVDGFEVCRRVRAISTVPILVLTAMDTPQDLVKALDLGADDYVTKPFSPDELMARIRALIRRSRHQILGSDHNEQRGCGDIQLNTDLREVRVGERTVRLTPTEWRLINEFVRHCGKILTHEQLLGKVWGAGYQQDHEYLRVYVRRLRSYIEPDARRPVYLMTQAGVGYVLYPKPHGLDRG